MAHKNWRAGGQVVGSSQALLFRIAAMTPFGAAWGGSSDFAPTGDVGSADPNMVWEMLIAGVVVSSFLAAIALWIHSALRKVKRLQLRRNAFVSSALNHLSHGVVMTDAQNRIVLCNDRYLEIYGLASSDISGSIT